MNKKPNFLVITADQLQPMALGCYGNTVCKTPNIDSLAAGGLRFSTAVSNMPICMAARSVLISGQYNRSCTGGISNVSYPSFEGDCSLPEYPFHGRAHLKDITVAEKLKSMGYYNAVIGKWHIHSWPQDIGFDEYIIPRVHHAHSSQLYTENGGLEFAPDGWSVDFELERANRFFEQRKSSDQPFFLYYNISPPHPPLADMPEKYLSMYNPRQIELAPNADEKAIGEGQRMAWDKDKASYPYKVHRWDYRYYGLHLPHCETLPEGYGLRNCIAEYYGAVSWTDDIFERLLQSLENSGLAENTWIIFTADHGELLGRGGLLGKGSSYIESAGIPFIVSASALPKFGRVCKEQVASLVDIAPTLIDIAGADIPDCWHGKSLLPIFKGECECLNENWAITETNNGSIVSIRTAEYMAEFEISDGILSDKPVSLFDIDKDPYEMNNLALAGQEVDMVKNLRDIVQEWNDKTPWMK